MEKTRVKKWGGKGEKRRKKGNREGTRRDREQNADSEGNVGIKLDLKGLGNRMKKETYIM